MAEAGGVPHLRIDANGTVVGLDDAWDQRLERHGVPIFRAVDLLGTPFETILDARSSRAWRQLLPGLTGRADRPPPLAHPLLRTLRPWPIESGVLLQLDGVATWLRRPVLRLEGGRVLPCTGAATRLLDADEKLADLRALESFLEMRSSPLRLAPLPGVRWQGRALFGFDRPAPYDVDSFDLLARIARAGLHDLSNPLAAMRMLAEVSMVDASVLDLELPAGDISATGRTSGIQAATASEILPLGEMTRYLDAAIDTIHGLRSLIHADAAASELDVAAELRLVGSLLRSELSRRDLELEIDVPEGAVTVAGTNAFRLLVAAGLLASCGRADGGGRLRLVWEASGEDAAPDSVVENPEAAGGRHRLECHVESAGAPALAGEFPSADLLDRLAAVCDGRVTRFGGERAAGEPDWRIELDGI